jgi:hypothetical protein
MAHGIGADRSLSDAGPLKARRRIGNAQQGGRLQPACRTCTTLMMFRIWIGNKCAIRKPG